MKSVHTILSSLLAGMMMFSLAACTASGTGASGADSSAVQTDAVPQGRWVEREADGISSGLVLGAAPAAACGEEGATPAIGMLAPVLAVGAAKASERAAATLTRARAGIGLLPR